jgi:Family of unknown function (DUF5691)
MNSPIHLTAPASWADLVASALVGTDRRPLPSPGENPAAALLDQAAARIVPAFAGRRPPAGTGTGFDPAPRDERPAISAAAALRLRSVIDAHPVHLPDWLAAAHRGGYRLPAALHTELLDLGRTNALIRPALARLLGPRGRWLAGFNGGWRYLLREPREDADPAHWTDPDSDVRLSYAAAVFHRDPAEGRDLLRAAWAAERVPVRLGLLTLLSQHAGPDDLPFLDSLATDASKQVRRDGEQLAAALRRRIGDSELTDFTTMAKHLLALHGLGREVYNFAAGRPGPWPEDGSRLILDSLAASSRRTSATSANPTWIRDQTLAFLGDRAPVALRPRVARLLAERAAAPDTPDRPESGPGEGLDRVLQTLDFRIAMLAELAPPDLAAA